MTVPRLFVLVLVACSLVVTSSAGADDEAPIRPTVTFGGTFQPLPVGHGWVEQHTIAGLIQLDRTRGDSTDSHATEVGMKLAFRTQVGATDASRYTTITRRVVAWGMAMRVNDDEPQQQEMPFVGADIRLDRAANGEGWEPTVVTEDADADAGFLVEKWTRQTDPRAISDLLAGRTIGVGDVLAFDSGRLRVVIQSGWDDAGRLHSGSMALVGASDGQATFEVRMKTETWMNLQFGDDTEYVTMVFDESGTVVVDVTTLRVTRISCHARLLEASVKADGVTIDGSVSISRSRTFVPFTADETDDDDDE